MEEKQERPKGKYKLRLMPAEEERTNLKEQYGEKEKKELAVQKSAAVRLSQICTALARSVMAVLALAGGVSLVRPELRHILAEIILAAVREIKGF